MRAQISVALDSELSQLERAMVNVHLARCAECRAYEVEVAAFTHALREAPLERTASLTVRRLPRRATLRAVPAVAAGLMIAVAGVATQLASNQARDAGSERLAAPRQFPTQSELERELSLLEIASGADGGKLGGPQETVR